MYSIMPGHDYRRSQALDRLTRLHEAQRAFHRGGSGEPLRALLAKDIRWTVPGRSAIAGRYEGIDEVIAYFAKRREISSGTFEMHTSEVLTGDGDYVAALTEGTAVVAGREERWSTVGLYRFGGDTLAECWLLPLDADQFDQIWGAASRR